MKILISIIITISNYKIKMKNDKAFIKILIKTHEIFNKNHIIFNNYSDKIKIDLFIYVSDTDVAKKSHAVLQLLYT